MIRAATAALIGLLGVAHADDSLRLRVESALGFDSNITRTEGDEIRGGPLARAVLDVSQALRHKRLNMAVTYQGGARKFLDARREDGLFQRLVGQVLTRIAPRLVVGVAAQAQNRTTRDSMQPRDFTRLGGGPTVTTRLGPVRLTLAGQIGRLVFEPDPDFNANSLSGTATLTWQRGAWRVDGRGGWASRAFEGLQRDQIGQTNDGPVVALGDVARVDNVITGGVGLRYQGDVIARAGYTLVRNTSNSFGAAFMRHVFSGAITTSIPLDCVLSLRADLQRVTYDDRQYIRLGRFIEDENRSSAAVRLERPIAGAFSLVGHVGGWFSPFGGGPEYTRYTALLGVAANIDR